MKNPMKMATRKIFLFAGMLCFMAMSSFAQMANYFHSDNIVRVPPVRSGLVIYNQFTEISSNGITSQKFTDVPENTCYAADDFIVPEGSTWNIRFIDVAGFFMNNTGGPASAVNVFIYSDDNGKPGNAINTFSNVTSINQTPIDPAIFKLEISLPSTLALTGGHYWLGVQLVGELAVVGQWLWCEQAGLPINDEYNFKNPLDGFGTGMIDWTPASQFSWGYLNLAFAFYGPSLNDDLAMISIEAPVTSAGLGASETITVKMKNESPTTQTGFNVSYSVDGGAVVNENVGSFSLAANETSLYSFAATANLSSHGPHTILASVNLATDPRIENNTASAVVYNLGTIYPMIAAGASTITACGATFTDSGGLDGDFGMTDLATTTILPASPGSRVKLNFLTFDVSYGGFSIYNGANMNAPLIGTWYGTNNPGEVEALNAAGALTIHFEGPGWETRSGWSAYISCYTPVINDFAALAIKCNIPTMFLGDHAIVSAKVQNHGTLPQSKTVTFKSNDIIIGTQTTPLLNLGDTAWVSLPYSPVNAGIYNLVASLPADMGPQMNDTVSVQKQVFPFGTFYEDFENPVFPPENWRQGGSWARGNEPAVGSFSANCFIDFSSADTLVSPRLDIHQGDMLTFAARTTMWWVGNLEVYWLDEQNSTWNYMQTIPMSTNVYTIHTIDMSQAEGIHRIGFMVNVVDPGSWAGSVYLDDISGQGITVHNDDHDLKAKSFEGNAFYNVNEPTNFQVIVRNDGLVAAQAASYRVALMKGGPVPVELFSLPGQTIALQQEIAFNLSYSFANIDNFPVYAEVVYAEDQYPSNNKSRVIELTGLSNGSVVVPVGTDDTQANWPIDFSYNQSLTETIYLNSEINQTGMLFGMSYDYKFIQPETDVPVRIWVGETSLNDISNWVPATQMTLVFDGTLNYASGINSIYIPFQTPYNYSNPSLNLVVMTEKIEDHNQANQNFYAYATSGLTSIEMAGDTIPDPNNPSGAYASNMNPSIKFIFNANIGSVSGNVSVTNGPGLGGVKVSVDELGIFSTTDASGHYLMPSIPAGEYQVTAAKFTYLPVTKTVTVSSNNSTSVDFVLNLLDLLSVSGRVVGSNDPSTGIANALVTLNGYSNYSAITDAQGYFTLENVYSNNTYTLGISDVAYDAYSSQLILSNSNVDLGIITLTESLLIPYAISANEQIGKTHLTWFAPNGAAKDVISFDDGVHENGYAGEPNEEVWLGNLFPVPDRATVSSFDLYWAGYGVNSPQSMRLDIFDEQTNLIASSAEFISGIDKWINVDIPNLTLFGNYYVMIHWSGSFAQSTYLAIDTTGTNPNYAYYLYPGGTPQPLSGLVGQTGTFLIHANAMVGGKKDALVPGSTAGVTGYNVYRGLLSDIANSGNWPKLNTEAIAETTYDDATWPSAGNGYFVYAVKANYSQGVSELSFSNVIQNLYTKIDQQQESQFSVYPNPASGVVYIDNCRNTQITLFSIEGKLIMRKDIHDNHYRINVNGLSKGVYSLTILGESGIMQQKLVVN